MNGILCKHLLWKSHFTTILSRNRVANETLSVIKNSCNKNFDDVIDLQGKNIVLQVTVTGFIRCKDAELATLK